MCGFAGITYHDREKLEKMAAPISMRARDKEVFFGIDNELSFYHAPLKISDLDKNTDQPFVTEGIIVGFVGEIYNREYLISLCSDGVADEYSELEIITLYYKKFGPHFIDFFNGEFSIFIYDSTQEKYYLFRDRYGVHAVYYRIQAGELYFSSEIKSLLFSESDISRGAIAEYMTFGFTVSPRTLFQDISILTPGHYLEFASGQPLMIHTFGPFHPQQYHDSFLSVFESAVKRRIPRFQNKILMPLSGGRDSNLTLSYLKKYFDGKIIAYTFLSENNEQDVEVAHKNAQFHNIRHIVVDLRGSQNSLESDFYTHEGVVQLVDITRIMKSYLGEDEDVRVEFSGDGREEFFGLNNHFDYDKIAVLYQHFLKQQLFQERNTDQEFLNDVMFDFNLQLIEKMTLRNGIERRLPFTDYELLPFRTTYTNYQQDAYRYLQNEGLSVVNTIYGHNQGSGFRYGDQAFLKKHIPKYSQYLSRGNHL